MSKKLLGGLGKVGKMLLANDDEGALNAIRAAGRVAHEQEAAARAAKNAQVAEQMANLPARNKKANEALGLYHPVGGGIKLSKPVTGMHATTVADPKFNPPDIGIITPEQLVKEEAALFPLVGDRAAGGRYLTHVGENELETPVRLTAGPRYMDANYNHLDPEESAAWESGLGRVTALGRQAERAGADGRPVYGIYTAGSGTNTDFNIMGTNALLQQLPYSKITKKSAQEFDRAMREASKQFPAIPDWPGILSPDAQAMLLDKSNGIARTKLLGTMGKENFQAMGFPDVPATRKAIIEPELLDVPTNQTGFRLARMDTTGRIIEQPNIPSDYPVAMAGKVAGKLDVPADYKDVFQTHFDRRRLLSQPESGDYYSFSRAHPIQYADDEWLNRLMEQRRLADLKIKEGEYKKGGAIDIKEADKRLAAAIEKRMAKGGAVDIEAADARLQAAIDARLGMADGGGAFKKLEFMADGGKLVKGAKKVMDVLTKLPTGTEDAQKAVAAEMAARKAAQEAAYAPHTLPTEKGNKTIANAKRALGKEYDAPQAEALRLAQERAALPPAKGGLGLPANNTPAQRAKAMGFDKDTYHGSVHDIKKFDSNRASTESHAGRGVYSTDSPRDASENYASIYGADVAGKVDRGMEQLEKDWRRTHGRMKDEALTPRQQQIILGNTVNADNIGVVYPLKVRSDKSIHLDKPESNPHMVGPFERYDEASDMYVDTPSTPRFNRALKEYDEMGGETNPIREFMLDYADEEGKVPARDLFNTIKKEGNDAILYDPYSGDMVSGGVAAGDFMQHFDVDEIRHTPQFMNPQLNIGGEHTISMNPDNVRSRFAAFDPFRKNAAIAAAMGVAAPDLLAKEKKPKEKKKAEGGIAMAKGGKFGNVLEGAKKVSKVLMAPQDEVIKAPSVIIPSKVSNVEQAIRQSKGEYGAKRVQRAADKIPNLERLYTEKALTQAFGGDNAKALMAMNPADFEEFAHPILELETRRRGVEPSKANYPTDEYIKYLSGLKGFDDVPFLEINKKEQGLPLIPYISGHEGRHRNRALANRGESAGLVQLLPRSELREPFPRRSQEEYLEALLKELEMTDNLVLPEKYFPADEYDFNKQIQRPAIKLPEIFAEGGSAFKTLQWKDAQHFDGGGIAVDLSEPSEDARREPALTDKDWSNIKRNAPKLYKLAKEQVAQEASQLKTLGGAKDFALRTGAQYLGGIPDLVNLGLMGVDAGLDTNLSSERPWLGSERYLDALKSSGAIGENEFPLAEITAGILAPAGLIKKGMKKMRKMPSPKEEPKKRLGGLTALSR